MVLAVETSKLSDLKWTDLDRLSRLGTLCVLVAAALANLAVLARTNSNQEEQTKNLDVANLWSAAICVIAAGCYYELNAQHLGIAIPVVRNLDWLITCPLLVLEMGSLLGAQLPNSTLLLAVALSAAMILIGWGDKVQSSRLVLGFIALGLVGWALFSLSRQKQSRRKQHRSTVLFFFALWLLYGAVAVLRSMDACQAAAANTGYNVLDAMSKAAFGLTVAFLSLKANR